MVTGPERLRSETGVVLVSFERSDDIDRVERPARSTALAYCNACVYAMCAAPDGAADFEDPVELPYSSRNVSRKVLDSGELIARLQATVPITPSIAPPAVSARSLDAIEGRTVRELVSVMSK